MPKVIIVAPEKNIKEGVPKEPAGDGLAKVVADVKLLDTHRRVASSGGKLPVLWTISALSLESNRGTVPGRIFKRGDPGGRSIGVQVPSGIFHMPPGCLVPNKVAEGYIARSRESDKAQAETHRTLTALRIIMAHEDLLTESRFSKTVNSMRRSLPKGKTLGMQSATSSAWLYSPEEEELIVAEARKNYPNPLVSSKARRGIQNL